MKKVQLSTLALALLGALAPAAHALAMEANWSGFATIGYAASDSDYTYQRFIDKHGSLKRDSVIAGQLDLRLSPQWSATVQVKLGVDEASDRRWRIEPSWAFVGWRPHNDWLLRAGKMRAPLYLNSESLDIGVAHDLARHPFELYSVAPTNDFTGAFVTHSIALGERELSVDAFFGDASTHARTWRRDGLPPMVAAGANFTPVDLRIGGIVLTARDAHATWRLGWQEAATRFPARAGMPATYPRVDIAPGLGYWQVDAALPGPGVPLVGSIHNTMLTAGADIQAGQGWRVVGEIMRIRQRDTELGADIHAAYVAVSKRVGSFTPYVSLARQVSSQGVRAWHERLTQSPLPAFIPQAAQINAVQRLAGESLYAFDQHSIALGTAYALSATSKFKFEWMRTRVGQVSRHFDTPAGQPDARDMRVNVLSLNYSVAF